MSLPRYVLLVLDDHTASVRAAVRRLCEEQAWQPEVVTCTSADQVHARLSSGRPFSAVVGGAGLDATVVHAAARAATPVLAVPPDRAVPPDVVLATLRSVAVPIRRADGCPELGPQPLVDGGSGRSGRLVGVCGPGGTGTSVVARTLAGHLAGPPGRGDVLLADFALRADQALLHRRPDPPTGLLELVDACRLRAAEPHRLRAMTVAAGGYRLLPGLRRPAHWTAVSPRAFNAALDGLGAAFGLVVADLTGDFEGEADVGSIDVEERNHMARRVTRQADAVVVVGRAGRAGARRLALVVDELLDHGVDPSRIQPVFNHVTSDDGVPPRLCGLPAPPIALPWLSGPAPSLLPFPVAEPLCAGATALLDRLAPPARPPDLQAVVAGSVGSWSECATA